MNKKGVTSIVSCETFTKKLKSALTKNHIYITDEMKNLIYKYYTNVLFWNRTHNLTRITELEPFIYKHIIDSLIPLSIKKLSFEGLSIADVGSGGGFPGIPLSITCPSSNFTLIDKVQKKTNFLFTTATELGLKNVSISHSLIQNVDKDFDVITVRAVNATNEFISIISRKVVPGGKLILYLSPNQFIDSDKNSTEEYLFSIMDFERKITVISL